MSGSLLGRGRGGRFAIYGGCGVVVILLVFLYRAATSEMTRLRNLHEQCVHQQEALAAQLQVIFEYKIQLEKFLTEEKSSNAVAKQELKKRATQEKSLRDEESETKRRFNSLQQSYKILESQHHDLQEEQNLALEKNKRLESTIEELRTQAGKDEKSLEHFKSLYLEADTKKTEMEDKYNELRKNIGNTDSDVLHLQKLNTQLKMQLEEAKKSHRESTPGPSLVSSKSNQQLDSPNLDQSGSQRANLAGPPFQQQNIPTASGKMQTPVRVASSTKSSEGAALLLSDKDNPSQTPNPLSRAKPLPRGVLPIPDMQIEADVKSGGLDAKEEKAEDAEMKNESIEMGIKEKSNKVDDPLAAGRHDGEEIPARREWPKPRPGVQEFGDDTNRDGKISGLDDGAQAGIVYNEEAPEYDPDTPQKSPDIRIEEGEDEGEDEEV